MKYVVLIGVLFLLPCKGDEALNEILDDLIELKNKSNRFHINLKSMSFPDKSLDGNLCLCINTFLGNLANMLNYVVAVPPHEEYIEHILRKMKSNIKHLKKSGAEENDICEKTKVYRKSATRKILKQSIEYIKDWNEYC